MPSVLSHDTEDLVATVRAEIDDADAPPWGAKATYDDDFQAIKTRIDSLGTLSGSIDQEKALSDEDGESIFEDDDSSGDFEFIVETGTSILAEKSKDLRIACYVALGLYRTDGFSGLAAGLDVLHALVDTYWENLYPAKRRMRARGAAIGFLMQRLSDAFEADPPKPTVDDRDALEHALERLGELQTFFMEEMGEHAPITSKLKRLVEETLRKAPEPVPPASEDSTDTPDADAPDADPAPSDAETSTDSDNEAATQGDNSTQAETEGAGGDRRSSETETRKTHPSPSAVSPPAQTGDGSPEGADAGEASVSVQIPDAASENEVVGAIIRGAGVLRDSDRTDARPYRLVRSVRWDPMQQAPPNDGGETRIQPPTSQRCDYLRGLLDNGETITLIRQAEDSFQQPPFHFWLDLQHLLVRAMDAEGDEYAAARAGITADVVQLVQRVPDLPDLSFADGTPFADAATRAWISDEVEAATNGGSGPADAVAEAIDAARSTLASDGIAAALHELQQAPVGDGRRSAFRVRLAKGQLCLRADQNALALPLLEALSEDLDAAEACDFDQTLAVDTWCALYQACSSQLDTLERGENEDAGEDKSLTEVKRVRKRAEETYRRICAMSPARALDLDAPNTAK